MASYIGQKVKLDIASQTAVMPYQYSGNLWTWLERDLNTRPHVYNADTLTAVPRSHINV